MKTPVGPFCKTVEWTWHKAFFEGETPSFPAVWYEKAH